MVELDGVESLEQLDHGGDIKNKFFFSVLVVSEIKSTVQALCSSLRSVFYKQVFKLIPL